MRLFTTIAAVCCILLSGCEKDDAPENTVTKALDFEEFSLSVPSGWRSFHLQGYDSDVGGVTNGTDTLIYDYGMYSSDLSNQTSITHIRDSVAISGYPAIIVRPKKKGQGIIGMYLVTNDQQRFILSGRNIENEEVVLNMFYSVRL